MSLHDEAGPGDAHAAHFWAYANLTDRDAHNPSEGPTRAITAEDVALRRQCWVESVKAFYVLLNHSPVQWGSLDRPLKEHTEPAPDRDTAVGNLYLKSVNGNSTHRFTCPVPVDFNELVSIELLAVPASSFTDQDIDLFSDYGEAPGENSAQHSESDTASLYSGTANQWLAIDLSGVLSAIAAGDICGVLVDHNSIGTTIYYYGIRLRYY